MPGAAGIFAAAFFGKAFPVVDWSLVVAVGWAGFVVLVEFLGGAACGGK